MTERKTYPDNMIRVNFKNSKKNINLKSLYPEAFAMYVDTESDNPDDFSKHVLETLKEEEDTILKANNPENNEDG
ncbi:MAG: hypothetical protein ACQER7_15725 [Bacteroidota bacterium]